MNIKSFILLVVALFTMSSVFANTEYNYELEIDYDFEDDEEIECKLDFGNSKKTKTFDENDDRNDMTFEGRFDDDISVECDKKVDIDLKVLDLEDNEIDDIKEKDVKDFYYELELFDAIINIDYNFPENVDILNCDLEIDEIKETLTYEKIDDSEINEEVEFEFLKELKLDCTEDLDELRLRVEDPIGKDIYDLYLEDEDKIEFDENTPRHKYNIAIFFIKRFEEDTQCDINIDSNNEFTLEFDDSSSGSKRNIEYVFGEDFTITCDEYFEEALVDIQLLEEEDQVFQKVYKNLKDFSISEGDIDNYKVEENNEIEEESESEKIYIPEIVNPQPENITPPEEEIEVELNLENITTQQKEENQTNLTTTPINETQEDNITNKKSEPINIVYVFIGIVSLILVITIVILVIKL